jgi:hypothetical protein
MMRFNIGTETGRTAYVALQASGAVVDPTTFTQSTVYA